ncbi:MAG: helix-turn-helix transcriptional regulator [Cyanobacteria bacterium SIG26]|nr:helix-turn-helix transcriptional regulator [Cyanobacteria bacterium SIG26]
MIENRVSLVMGAKRMEKRDITKITNIDRHTLTKIYKGEIASIKLDTLNQLCYALDCTPNDLFRYIPD